MPFQSSSDLLIRCPATIMSPRSRRPRPFPLTTKPALSPIAQCPRSSYHHPESVARRQRTRESVEPMSALLASLSASDSSSDVTSNEAEVPGIVTLLPAARFPAVAALYGLKGCHGLRRRSRCIVARSLPTTEGAIVDSDCGRRSVLRIVDNGLPVSLITSQIAYMR
jgi:hypothetical protein